MSALIPDLHHYKGSFGGRVYPLWADAQATQSNVRADVLQALAKAHGAPVAPEDLVAYIAAVMAHPAFTARFRADLVRPGLRVPLTADRTLFDEAAALGREVVWLHCYGERFVDPAAGRPKGPPRLPKGEAPFIPGRRRHSRRARAAAGDHGLRRGQAAPRHRQGLRRERHAGHARLRDFRQDRARPMVQLPSARPDQTA